ncbi:BTB/POZ domain-containing protein 6-like isoform X1 [Sitodiplosis mosellana]|uniref:BTB/POZ domain-containing protein 6-like isoform X1 n=2 Tax=Sitodiplosis mosellana TaxID=263140 RepID=UPI0024439750|nr:BTB/POZ domain-containing protein 6-like isoform X1 [Sitodiplosis mosellana]
MAVQVFTRENKLKQLRYEQLYLKTKTSDLNFVCGGDRSTNIPGHKFLLSVASPVFEAMFYGSTKPSNDIPIDGISTEAFKEFLQLFYLNKVQLTSLNIIEVVQLCKKYEVADGLSVCESPLVAYLITNLDDMCLNYGKALNLNVPSAIRNCGLKIGENAFEVLKSSSFLKCDRKLLDKILEIVASKCSPSVIVESCMAWAKAECVRQQLDITTVNLKAQLKNSLNRIPFDKLSTEQFSQHINTYKRFFVEDELESLVLTAMSKKAKLCDLVNKLDPSMHLEVKMHLVDCDRRLKTSANGSYQKLIMPHSITFMSSALGVLHRKIGTWRCFANCYV